MGAVSEVATAVGGLAAFAVALFYIARWIRADVTTRVDAYINRLERDNLKLDRRIVRLERHLAREERRRFQLEAIMRAAHMEIPAWTMDPADIDDLDDAFSEPAEEVRA